MIKPHAPILAVGSMAFDSITTPSGKAESVLGGSVNYFSVAASVFSPVQIVAVVGTDFPKSHLHWLEERGIDTHGVQVEKGKTFHWVGSYTEDLNNAKTIQTALNVFENFNPKLTAVNKAASHIFLGNIDPEIQFSVLDQVQNPKLIACDTMNFWINSRLDQLKAVLKKVDIISINDAEAQQLSGEKNTVRAAEKIREMGPEVVLIKRGEYGALLYTGRSYYPIPAFPLKKVVDPTGAGDTFAGAFMGYLAKRGIERNLAKKDPKLWDHTLRRGVIAGCVMASFTVEDFSLNRIKKLTEDQFEKREVELLAMLSPESF